MVNGLIGRKVGMTQIFGEDGMVIPVTVLKVGPCVVVQRKTSATDGYEAAQIGFVEEGPDRKANRAKKGHFEKAGVPPTRILREFSVPRGADPKPGETYTCEIFSKGERVDIIGTSKGRGFQGVMKRHNFGGGRATHGSMFHRSGGSIGQSAWPSKVFKGMRMPGQMGARRANAKGLEVVGVDSEQNLLLIRGSVPGARGSILTVQRRAGAPAAE